MKEEANDSAGEEKEGRGKDIKITAKGLRKSSERLATFSVVVRIIALVCIVAAAILLLVWAASGGHSPLPLVTGFLVLMFAVALGGISLSTRIKEVEARVEALEYNEDKLKGQEVLK